MEAFTHDLQSITEPFSGCYRVGFDSPVYGSLSPFPALISSWVGVFFIQGNLLASGANDSEIFIWDLNNLSVPMTPGSKSQVRRLLGLLLRVFS